ncbi:hypothetical protein [Streptomyces sp. MZ04]|uniref:hypothetical protein n=1 Tax=Streptomyces sp. MZ04 TaxID=2559236 RepID=UPI00143342CE|nr:hypothetical protein [Streptomyces sp. MZ04]
MTGEWAAEPSGHSNVDLFVERDQDERPADIRGQHVSGEQWATAETVTVAGEWL